MIKILKAVCKQLLNFATVLDDNYGMYFGLNIRHMSYIMNKQHYSASFPSEMIKILYFKSFREMYWPKAVLFAKNLIFKDTFCPHYMYYWMFKMMVEFIMHLDRTS